MSEVITYETRQEILAFIVAYRNVLPYCPTIREIGEAVSIKTPSVVKYHLDYLARLGYLDWLENQARTVHATREGNRIVIQILVTEFEQRLQKDLPLRS